MIMCIGTFIIKEVSTVIVTSVLLHFLDGLDGSILGLSAISALCVHELHNSLGSSKRTSYSDQCTPALQ